LFIKHPVINGQMTGRVIGNKLDAQGAGGLSMKCWLTLVAKFPVRPTRHSVAVAEAERSDQSSHPPAEVGAGIDLAPSTGEQDVRAEYEARLNALKNELGKQSEEAAALTELAARQEAEAVIRRKYEAEIRKLQEQTAAALAQARDKAWAEGETAARQRYEAQLQTLQQEKVAAVAQAELRAKSADLAATDQRTVRNAQSALADLGHYDGALDGVIGPTSRAAVSAYQSAKGFAADGELTTEQLTMLLLDATERRRKGSAKTGIVAQGKPPLDLDFGNYHALLIGNNDYTHLRSLKTAVADATALAQILKDDYGFETSLLTNVSRAEILGALNVLRTRLREDDNLLIYYAGHGVMDWEADEGYWLPVDAERSNDIRWLANDRLTRVLRAMAAKHVMIVADSCYSGSLVRESSARIETSVDRGKWIERMSRKRARTVMTSGGLEPVMDGGGGGHSVFAKALLHALAENTNVIEGQELFDRLKRPVVVNSDQTPDYSDIRRAGHDGGDFLFVRRRSPISAAGARPK